jgi:hypothetical protein
MELWFDFHQTSIKEILPAMHKQHLCCQSGDDFVLVVHSLGVALLNLGIAATTNETFFKTDGSPIQA